MSSTDYHHIFPILCLPAMNPFSSFALPQQIPFPTINPSPLIAPPLPKSNHNQNSLLPSPCSCNCPSLLISTPSIIYLPTYTWICSLSLSLCIYLSLLACNKCVLGSQCVCMKLVSFGVYYV